jgi:hypothetical protein
MRRIAAQPVRRVAVPAYPTKFDVLAEPDLLARHVTPAWLAKAEVAGMLAVFLTASVAGCSDKAKLPRAHVNPQSANTAIVAPVFEHGEGRGYIGGGVARGLPEEEALQVIEEELTRAGLELSARNVALPDVVIPHRRNDFFWDAAKGEWRLHLVELSGPGTPLQLKFQDADRRIALTYVGERSHYWLGGPESGSMADACDFKEVAHFVADKFAASGTVGYLGVFYDPLVEVGSEMDWAAVVEGGQHRVSWQAEKGHALRESKRLLREQVKDFVDWLKGQGVI